jgi:isopenicillin-N N-acyltransferase-like protein
MRRVLSLLAILLFAACSIAADAPKPFPAAKQGKGELFYVDSVPVLKVQGTPAEMGEQFGKLAIAPAPDLNGLLDRFLADSKQTKRYPLIVFMAHRLKPNFPPHIAAELEAAGKAGERDEGSMLFANTVADLSSGLGCATLVIEKERSKTGSPLFGRNFDWQPTQGLTEHTLVAVYKGEGKRAFAAVTVTPITGVISGMNDAGLSITINEVRLRASKDKSAFNWKGTPLLYMFRRVLEECGSVAEAEKFLRNESRTSSCCMTLCDKNGGAVFEITPTNLEVRSAVNGVECCTNHFRTDKLCTDMKCWRYDKLSPLETDASKLGVADVFAHLNSVNQGKSTLQSMVFEPSARVLHLAYGEGPATTRKATKLELGTIFDAK